MLGFAKDYKGHSLVQTSFTELPNREHEAGEELEQNCAIFSIQLTNGFPGFIRTLLLASCDVSGLDSSKFQQKVFS